MSDKIKEIKMSELKDLFFYTFGIVPLANYDVVGDGVTDNRLALQQAIYDTIDAGAKYIFVSKGEYYYTGELVGLDEVEFCGNSNYAYIEGVTIKRFPKILEDSKEQLANLTEKLETKMSNLSTTLTTNYMTKISDKAKSLEDTVNNTLAEKMTSIDNIVVPIGGIIQFPKNGTIPDTFMECNGTTLNISDYQALYELFKTPETTSTETTNTSTDSSTSTDEGDTLTEEATTFVLPILAETDTTKYIIRVR